MCESSRDTLKVSEYKMNRRMSVAKTDKVAEGNKIFRKGELHFLSSFSHHKELIYHG